MQKIARETPVAPTIQSFALEIVRASRPSQPPAAMGPTASIRLGASPRAAQALLLGAKVLAIVRGRYFVTRDDVLTMAAPVLEHRLVLDMRAGARGVKPEMVVTGLVAAARKRHGVSGIFWN